MVTCRDNAAILIVRLLLANVLFKSNSLTLMNEITLIRNNTLKKRSVADESTYVSARAVLEPASRQKM